MLDVLGLKKAGFMNPTPIQERALTASLRDRKDILGAAKTVSYYILFDVELSRLVVV